jgi:hypothetical protein
MDKSDTRSNPCERKNRLNGKGFCKLSEDPLDQLFGINPAIKPAIRHHNLSLQGRNWMAQSML